MSLKSLLLALSALMVSGSSVWADSDTKMLLSPKRPVAASTAVRTAPGVVVRKTLPNNLEFNALGIVTPALTDDLSSARIGQATVIPRSGVQKPQSFVGGFTFTPSGRVTDDRAFKLGFSSRVQGVTDGSNGAGLSAAAPANYAVGFALGYHGFALEGGYNRIARSTRALAEGMDVGVSYRGADWKTSLKVSQEAIERDPYGVAGLFAPQHRRAVELGGAYSIARGVSLTGGLRYQLAFPPDGKRSATLEKDAGAVFLGTAVDF